MRKKLSILIAMVICLSTSTTSFAAENINTSNGNSASVQVDNSTLNLTMYDAVSSIEKNNTEIKLMKDKTNYLNRKYDLDHEAAIALSTSANGVDKIKVRVQQDITPAKDQQEIKNQQYALEVRLNNMKFDMERQYLNILTSNDQIDNINKTLTNIDAQISKLQQQIDLGLATSDSLNTLNVQKSQLMSQTDSINADIDNSMLIIKQYLNVNLNRNLNLATAKKEFSIFDDTSIENIINEAVEKDYGVGEAKNSLDIAKKQKEIYEQYDNDISGGLTGAESDLLTAQSNLTATKAAARTNLWNKYYTLKSDESAVETQALSEKSAQDAYDKAKSNYNNGMTDKLALDTAALALDKQKNMSQRSKNEYMIIQEELKYMLDGHASAQPSTKSIGTSGIDY
ncbi:TolC family protein [Clostridium sp. P21]|uniref:TolC family protein n=1 Tax=Clostridium muellerianum TaxID=2716538 RepID=A0A7Y0HRC8_9CLOT|nr:TolC family protein [Clostridium muellerianum]NMM65071.1 TolC family protein [Clostridium muellerianum]